MNPEEKTSSLFEVMKQETMQTVVHDLRTPITVIKGYLELLMSGAMGALPNDQMMVLKRSVGPLQEMMLLTENLLQASTLDQQEVTLMPSPTDLDRLLSDTIEFYQLPFAQRRMQIYRAGNTLGLTLRVDGFWVRRLLNNLIWNAYKYTPDGGTVMLHVRHSKGKTLEIAVEDTGRGIPADKLATIFDKYEQAHNKDRKIGTGLGLWICKKIMELHGGSVRAESDQGGGSRFVLSFPASVILPMAPRLQKSA